ncbi:MAG: serine hydrolase, partial [Gammaproteobacteria bacterium]|nr:serine hydrolase [Gammaproteobacteria bacterium]
MLYARLVERGDARWDQPVASLFPDLIHEISPAWNDRTIEELIVCQGGMQANPSRSRMFAGYGDDRSMADQRTDAAMAAMRDAPGPRGRFVYSNSSYMVVGAAIDRITREPFERALERHVLEPLGIASLSYGPPERVCGHGPLLRIGNLALFAGRPADPNDPHSDNPRMFSSAGTMHVAMVDWAKFLGIFVTGGGGIVKPQTVDDLLRTPKTPRAAMGKGWARAELKGVSTGMQGSNTLWSATALLNTNRTKSSFVVCNDGRRASV